MTRRSRSPPRQNQARRRPTRPTPVRRAAAHPQTCDYPVILPLADSLGASPPLPVWQSTAHAQQQRQSGEIANPAYASAHLCDTEICLMCGVLRHPVPGSFRRATLRRSPQAAGPRTQIFQRRLLLRKNGFRCLGREHPDLRHKPSTGHSWPGQVVGYGSAAVSVCWPARICPVRCRRAVRTTFSLLQSVCCSIQRVTAMAANTTVEWASMESRVQW